jgi:prepilin-type processing-associated H-X9-DG protein
MYMGNYFSVPTDPASDENTYTTWRFTPSVSGVHGNSTNFLLADGHVERIRTLEDQVSYARQFHWDVPVNAYKSLNSKPRW